MQCGGGGKAKVGGEDLYFLAGSKMPRISHLGFLVPVSATRYSMFVKNYR